DRARSTLSGGQREEGVDGLIVRRNGSHERNFASTPGSPATSGARMRAVVDPAKALPVHVAVHLRGRQGTVAEQLLDRPQVGAAFEQMRRERVAEAMRMREDPPYGRGVEAAPSRGDEQRVLGAARELRPRLVQIPRETVGRLLAERDDPFLASLSEHAHVLLLEVHVAEVQRDG